MPVSRQTPKHNWLLNALPAEVYARLESHLEPVKLPVDEILYEADRRMSHVYFPTDGIISLLYLMKGGGSAEIAIVGREGLVGVALFMGGGTTPSQALVQSAGYGYRLKAEIL